MKRTTEFMSMKRIRLIGFLYLGVIILAGFSQGYVRGTLIVPGSAEATSTNLLLHEGLFRLGLATDLMAFILDAVISVLLYQLFKPYGKTMALVSSALRLIAHPAIGSLNLIHHYLALMVLGEMEFLTAFDMTQLQSMSLMYLEAHRNGYLIAGGFFGLHCMLLGWQIFRSDIFPMVFAILMIAAGTGYLLETFGNFILPGYEGTTALIVGISAALGELGLTLYILIKGSTRSYKDKLRSAIT